MPEAFGEGGQPMSGENKKGAPDELTAEAQVAKIFKWRRGFNAMHLIDLNVRTIGKLKVPEANHSDRISTLEGQIHFLQQETLAMAFRQLLPRQPLRLILTHLTNTVS